MNIWFYKIRTPWNKIRFLGLGLLLWGVMSAPVTAQNMMEDIHDIRGPVKYPGSWSGWLIALIVLIGLGSAVFWGKRKLGAGRAQRAAAPARPCWETALEALAQLAARDYINQRRVKIFYSELSDILRRYIEARFQIAAPEMTTEEFLESLRQSLNFNTAQRRLLEEFLTSCDRVKFARAEVDAAHMQAGFDEVRDFVQATKEV